MPEDIVVAGFDDSGLAENHEPPLTTMRQPWDRTSEEMVALILEVIAGVPRRAVTLPTALVVRENA